MVGAADGAIKADHVALHRHIDVERRRAGMVAVAHADPSDAMRQGLVDQIIVYKIDRLTRSLADFSKIVDVLDAAGASFVSVTQSFNTATSMGRLTLNMLLSFAQFEREVTAERIRDKIAASKRKGLWMGGWFRSVMMQMAALWRSTMVKQ